MKPNLFKIVIFLMIGGLLISACSSASSSTKNAQPTSIPPVASNTNIVAESKIAPHDSRDLSFFTSGQVSEVLVKEGDVVKTGDLLARLGDRERIEAQISTSETALLNAQRALNDLNKPENLEVAKVKSVGAIATANKAVKDAQYALDNFSVPTNQQDLTPMEGIQAMKKLLDAARTNFEPYKYLDSGNQTRKDLKEKLDNTQADYNTAIRRLELETILEQAQANLDKAIKDSEALQNGPNPDDLASAQANVKTAEAALASAKASLKDLDLVATIDGTVVTQNLVVGQQVTPGQPAMTIADFSNMYALTDDLTEIEVVDISPGQKVTVVADALPDVKMTGVVESISRKFEEKRGDVTYTAKILLDNPDPRLRWGMTVVTTFQK